MHRRTLIAALVSPQCRKLTMGFIHCRVVKRVIISHRGRRIMQGVRSDTSPSPSKYNDKLSLYFFRESGRVQYIHALSRGVASTEAVPSRHPRVCWLESTGEASGDNIIWRNASNVIQMHLACRLRLPYTTAIQIALIPTTQLTTSIILT